MSPTHSPGDASAGSARRNQFEIWAGVLESCARTGRTQSWLLRRLRLKTSAIKEALEFLVLSNLIAKTGNPQGEGTTFLTTPRGEEALVTYYKLVTEYFSKQP